MTGNRDKAFDEWRDREVSLYEPHIEQDDYPAPMFLRDLKASLNAAFQAGLLSQGGEIERNSFGDFVEGLFKPQGGEWQDIETAPKDGTYFVCAIPITSFSKWRFEICYWARGMKEPRFVYNGWSKDEKPTKFMPLPTPPQEDAP